MEKPQLMEGWGFEGFGRDRTGRPLGDLLPLAGVATLLRCRDNTRLKPYCLSAPIWLSLPGGRGASRYEAFSGSVKSLAKIGLLSADPAKLVIHGQDFKA